MSAEVETNEMEIEQMPKIHLVINVDGKHKGAKYF